MASATAARTARTQETVADTLPGLWHEVPTGAALIVQPGRDEQIAFTPRPPG
jgi:hypothetical protein